MADVVGTAQTGEIRLIESDSGGKVWLVGTKALVELYTSIPGKIAAPRKPRITTAIEQGAELPSKAQNLRFEFSSGEFLNRDNIRFQTRLVGLDTDWSAPTNESQMTFPGLRDDRYELQVRTINALGQTSETASWKFTILPPWYQTGWALAGSMLALGGMVVGGMHLRQRLLVRRTRELEAAVALKTAEISRANAAKSEFIANMSHELRHPITGIIGGTVALEDSPISSEQLKSVRSIRHCASLLHHIVSDVLDLAKIEAGELTIEETSFVPSELMQSCVQMMTAAAEAANCRLKLELSPVASRPLRGDPGRIQQIVVNFLSNAFKFAPNTEVQVSVTENPGGWVRYAVRDHGPGITKSDQARLFQRFKRLGSSRGSINGTGIGLALCLEIARRMRGNLGVESTPGKGSTFFVDLQLVVAEAVPNFVIPKVSGIRRALVVDDIEYAAAATAAVARRLGFETMVAQTGAEALAAMGEHEVDLVLLDWDLGDHSGAEVMAALRQRRKARVTRYVATTAHADAEHRRQALALGFDDFLTKPVTPEKLAALLEPILRETRPAAPGAKPAQPASLDLTQLELLADGDPRDLARQVGRLREEIGKNLAALRKASNDGNSEAVRYSAHRLVNDGWMVGAMGLVAAAESLHRLAGTERHEDMRQVQAAVETQCDQVSALLEESVSRQKP